jgi:hypothetical protein
MDEPLVCQLSRPRYSVAFSAKGRRWVPLIMSQACIVKLRRREKAVRFSTFRNLSGTMRPSFPWGAAYPRSSWLPASLSSTEHSRFNNGTSFSTIAQTRASSTVGYSWVSWFRKSMILRAFVIASNVCGAARESAAMASPMMMNSRSTDERTSRDAE